MKVIIAIHFDNNLRKDNFAFKWAKILEKKGIVVKKYNFKSSDIIKKLQNCHGAMWHWTHNPDDKQIAPKVLTTIEKYLYIPIFPNINTFWHYDDKIAQHYIFDALNIPKIPSWVFWDYQEAMDFLETAEYPLVFKLSVGAGSANVTKVSNKKQAISIIKQIFSDGIWPYSFNEYGHKSILYTLKRATRSCLKVIKGKIALPYYYIPQKNYVYFQKFIPGNKFDIRVTVIGDRAFGFIRYNRVGDFRASGSGKIDFNPKNIPIEAVKIAHSISKQMNSQSMAYDFLIFKNQVLLSEISYCYLNTAIKECPGFWDSKLNWHNGSMWPEEAHVEDFLNTIKIGI